MLLRRARPNPAVIGLHRVGPEVDGELRLDPQQVAPLHGPVVGELVALQQPVDQGAAFVGVAVREELRGLLGGGQRADDVQIDAPDKHRVGAEVGRLDAQPLPLGEDQLVDLAVRGGLGVKFEGGHDSLAGTGGGRRGCQGWQDQNGDQFGHLFPPLRSHSDAAKYSIGIYGLKLHMVLSV